MTGIKGEEMVVFVFWVLVAVAVIATAINWNDRRLK